MSVTSNPKLEKALPAIFNGLLQFFSGLFRDIYFKDVTTGTKTTKAEKDNSEKQTLLPEEPEKIILQWLSHKR